MVKSAALAKFMDTPTYAGVGAEEQDRLCRQLWAMGSYGAILRQRIAAFTITP